MFRSEKKSKYFLCLGFVCLKRTSCRSETMCGILILNFNFEKFYLFFKSFPHFNRKYLTNEEQWGPGRPLVGKRKQKYANQKKIEPESPPLTKLKKFEKQ